MSSEATRATWVERWTPWLVAFVFVAFALRLLAFVDHYAVNLMVQDQWDLYAPLFDDSDWIAKFRTQAHDAPHRMGVAWLVIEPLARATAWDGRADAFAVAWTLIVAAGLAVAVKWRLTGRLEWSDCIAPVVVLNLKQFGLLVGTPTVSLSALPIALLAALVLSLTLPREPLRTVVLLAIAGLALYTGFGVLLAPIVPLVLIADWWSARGTPRADSRRTGLALAFWAAWIAGYFFDYRFENATRPLNGAVSAGDLLAYVDWLIASALGARNSLAHSLLSLLWPIAVVGVVAWCAARVLQARAGGAELAVLVLSSFSILFAVANAIGRSALGTEFALTPRYVTLMAPLLLATYLAIACLAPLRWRAPLAGGLLFALLMGELAADRSAHAAGQEIARRKQAWVSCYRVALSGRVGEPGDIARCNAAAGYELYPWRDEFPRIQTRLDWLRERQLNLFKPASPLEAADPHEPADPGEGR